jgi:membrane-associated phospholipid phosphatase
VNRIAIPIDRADRALTEPFRRLANKPLEQALNIITRAGDEHVVLPCAFALWIAGHLKGTAQQKSQVNHLLLSLLAGAGIDHVSKICCRRKRPYREVDHRKSKGIPRSAGPYDAFVSGHAVLLGAAASALARIYPEQAVYIWSTAALLATTRIALLAHWPSDVIAGFASGVAAENLMAWLTGVETASEPLDA